MNILKYLLYEYLLSKYPEKVAREFNIRYGSTDLYDEKIRLLKIGMAYAKYEFNNNLDDAIRYMGLLRPSSGATEKKHMG